MREKYIEQKLVREVIQKSVVACSEQWKFRSCGLARRLFYYRWEIWVGGSEGVRKETKSFTGAQA